MPIRRRAFSTLAVGGAAAAVAASCGICGWLLWPRRHAAPPAPVALAPPRPAPPPAERFEVGTADEAAILAHVAQHLTIFRFEANPNIVVLDFPTLRMQGEMLNRVATLVEKAGMPHDRVLTDAELDTAIRTRGDTVETYYYGHDYPAAALARFFALADRDHIALDPQEERLRALARQFGWLSPGATGAPINPGTTGAPISAIATRSLTSPVNARAPISSGATGALASPGASGALISPGAVGALITIVRTNETITEATRATILHHELSHGEFFSNKAYADYVHAFWLTAMSDGDRAAIRQFLGSMDYDTSLEELMYNEMQAYMMFTYDARFFLPSNVDMTPARRLELQVAFLKGMPEGWLKQSLARHLRLAAD